MNARFTTAAVAIALLGSSAAFAQSASAIALGDEIHGYGYTTPVAESTLTRADVKAEVARAQADGTLAAGDEITGYVQPVAAPTVVSTKSRAEVKAELQSARQRGELDGQEFHS